MQLRTVLLLCFCMSISCWQRATTRIKNSAAKLDIKRMNNFIEEESVFQPIIFQQKEQESKPSYAVVMLSILAVMLPSHDAEANEYGILAGKTASMLHPLTNFALFGTSLYSAYLGLQWRRLRGLGEELKELSAQLPTISTGPAKSPIGATIDSITKQLSELTDAGEDAAKKKTLNDDLEKLTRAVEIDSKIQELSTLRKNLLGANLRDKHWYTGSILLGTGVSVAILGAFNTYMRAGRLFPGPHLFAGMAITIMWAGLFLLYCTH